MSVRSTPAVVLSLALLAAVPGRARAQIAFFPGIGAAPNGVFLPVTPVVSHDRRYVRMTLEPQFNALEGFSTYSVPAAVSGGPNGPGALGGLGGGGVQVAAGMNGVVNPERFSASNDFASPEASAFLAGNAGYGPPRLSAGMVGDVREPEPAVGSRPARTGAKAPLTAKRRSKSGRR